MKKKVIALLLTAAMCVGMVTTAFAGEKETAAEDQMAVIVQTETTAAEETAVQSDTEDVQEAEAAEETAAQSGTEDVQEAEAENLDLEEVPADVDTDADSESDTDSITKGICGDGVSWRVVDGQLTIYAPGYPGTMGTMSEYDHASAVPWLTAGVASKIKKIIIKDGVLNISSVAFAGLANVTYISIPKTVTKIGSAAFLDCNNDNLTIDYQGTCDEWNAIKGSDSKNCDYGSAKITFKITGFVKNAGVWTYYEDGKPAATKNDFVYGTINGVTGYYYVRSGVCSLKLTSVVKGTINDKEGWYFVKNSAYFPGFTGFAQNEKGIWYVKNGFVDTQAAAAVVKGKIGGKYGWYYINKSKYCPTYTGFASNSNGDWYVKSGKVGFNVTSVIKGTVNGETAWFNVVKNKVTYTNTVASNSKGWWVIRNGKIDFTYTGLASNSKGSWLGVKGYVSLKKTGLFKVSGKWYYIVNSRWCSTYTGFAANSVGTWYVKNGIIDFSKSGRVSGTIDGVTKEWPVIKGKVVSEEDYNKLYKAQGYESDTNWLILIDCSRNRLYIYNGTGAKGSWSLKYEWECTTGAYDTPTVKGVYKITTNRGYSFSGPDDAEEKDYTCYYYSGFCGSYLIHSILYDYNSMNPRDDRMGMDLSHGCVRVTLDHAKWIYDNIPVGSTVVSY